MKTARAGLPSSLMLTTLRLALPMAFSRKLPSSARRVAAKARGQKLGGFRSYTPTAEDGAHGRKARSGESALGPLADHTRLKLGDAHHLLKDEAAGCAVDRRQVDEPDFDVGLEQFRGIKST
jgi:hypothetical protein